MNRMAELRVFGLWMTGLLVLVVGSALGNPTIVSYHDSTQLRPYSVQQGRICGVWVTPPAPTCSLVAVRYFFGDANVYDTPVRGFVSRVAHYPNGDSVLTSMGAAVDTFWFARLPMGRATTVDLSPIPANSTSDFFIGWTASAKSQCALWDSTSDTWPLRSYSAFWDSTHWNMSALVGDLAVSALFRCATPPPETGVVSVELRWNTAATDLDLYLAGKKDTVYWRKPKDSRGRRILDVDDADGYGAEIITYSVRLGPLADTMADVGVYYYGPAEGEQTGARVQSKRGGSVRNKIGWCSLKPKQWWSVGKINLRTGVITPLGPPYHVIAKPKLAKLAK
jgi:hypothetical protein